jgi:transcriptional regulator with XRE-family HTH domain
MKRTRSLGELLRARREGLGLTQRSLAQKLRVEPSHVAFIESGRRKPSLKLVAHIADTLRLERLEVLLLAHPEVSVLLSRTQAESRPTASPSWQRFIKNIALLARCHVTKRELQVLEHLSLLGTAISTKQFLAILMLIRDVHEHE